MIVTNTETVAGYQVIEIKGLVQGNTVRAKHAGRDIAASFKNLVGGELKGYTELLTESRRQAVERMLGPSPATWRECDCQRPLHHECRDCRRGRVVCLRDGRRRCAQRPGIGRCTWKT